jgi:uncharacterized protein YabE (DUF348 family)/3D (Asp-Asp-Asp) domain-containing protein
VWIIKKFSFSKRFWAILIVPAMFTIVLFVGTYTKMKTIFVVIDGKKSEIVTFKDTVEEVLKDNNILLDPKDKIQPSLKAELSKNDTINIKRAVNICVLVDGKNINLKSSEENVDLMLKSEGISLNSEDTVKPGRQTALYEGLKVEITRVETKTFVESFPINYKTIVKKDNNMLSTQKKVVREGRKGEKQVTVYVTYENGKEVSRKIIKEEISKKPIDKIVAQGTISKPKVTMARAPIASRGNLAFLKVFKAKATAYHAFRGVGKTYTSSGKKAVRNPEGYSTIAVDPKVIPMGTKLYVDGYGFAIAADTGSAIKGNKIDVFFNSYKEACNWGVKYVDVYVLK